MQPSEWGEEGQFDHLMASQQRDLRKLVENYSELDEDDFDLTRADGRWAGIISGNVAVPVIAYEPEQFFFSLTHLEPTGHGYGFNPGGHAVYFKPGEQTSDEWHMQLEWKDVRRYFDNWLGYIARELDLADDPDWEDDDDSEDEEYDEGDEPDQRDERDEEYGDDREETPATDDKEETPTPKVVATPEPDAPVVAEVVGPPTPPQPSRFQHLADWVKMEKNERGAFWGLVAFLVTVVLALVALL